MKRYLSLLVAVVMVFTFMLTGCGGDTTATEKSTSSTVQQQSTAEAQATAPEVIDPLGKYEPAINVSAVNVLIAADVKFDEGEDAGNNVWTKAYEDILGIKADVWWGTDNTDKQNLMVATGELPDIFGVLDGNFYKLAQAGKLQDLTEVYEKYASPLTKELLMKDGGRALEACKVNGKLYAIPYYEDPINNLQPLFVREDWRVKMGLPEPKTMNDVLTIATAFAKNDPDGNGKDDTIGLYLMNQGKYTLKGFFAGFHAYPYIWVKDDAGNLVHGMAQADKMKPALQWLQDAYKAGLISKEFPLKSWDQWDQDSAQEKFGILYGSYWLPEQPLQTMRTKNPKTEWKAYPLPSADDKPAFISSEGLLIKRFFVERAGVEHPEAMIKMINLSSEKLYGPNAEVDKYDINPVTTSNMWKYTLAYVYSPRKDYDAYIHLKDAVPAKSTDGLTMDEKGRYEKIMKFLGGDEQYWWINAEYGPGGSCGAVQAHVDSNTVMFNAFTGTKTENMNNYEANLAKAYDEVVAKIILNQAPVDAYDKFVEDWKSQGGDAMTKDANDWYATQKK